MRKKTLILMIFALLMALPTITYGQVPFDFSDDFYRANGIEPDRLLDRWIGDDERATMDSAPDTDHNDVRLLATTGGFNASGVIIFYTDQAKITAETFTHDEAGVQAMALANKFRAFIFPLKDGESLSPAPSNRRQDNLFDTDMEYFNVNKLGLWRLVFVRYTEAATNTIFGRKALRELAEQNGRDLDGTPVIKRMREINDLDAKGLIQLQVRADDGSDGFTWVT